jgi:probable FeS assembly SUF system protein SufT
MSQTYRLTRECKATQIPQGTSTTLPAGTEVFVVQTLGGNITVRTDFGLVRIAKEDASAIDGLSLSNDTTSSGISDSEKLAEKHVWDVLKTCFDPEIPVNIVDLGLIYDLAIEETTSGAVIDVKMTLTAPGCGMGPVIAEDARQKIAALPGVSSAKVHIVWDPIWAPQMISAEGRKALGLE